MGSPKMVVLDPHVWVWWVHSPSRPFPHPNQERYPGQRIFVIEIDGYAYLVPFVETEKEVFLKTVIPSRKATRKYLGRRKRDKI